MMNKLIAIAVAIAVILTAIFLFGQSQYKKGYSDHAQKVAVEVAKANEENRKKEQSAINLLHEKQKELNNEKIKTEQSITNMRTELKRLQHSVERRKRELSTNNKTTSASDEDSTRGWILFSYCAERYSAMAEIADKQNDDLREWQKYGEVIENY